MTTLTTTRCHSVMSPEIRIQFGERILFEDADTFLRGLEDTVIGGARYRSGESLQVGWTMTRFRELDTRLLGLFAPDMKSFPLRYEEDVTTMLKHLRIQKDVAESLELDVEFPSMFHAAVTCNRVGQATSLLMERYEPEGAASGWIILCREPGHDHDDEGNLVRESLYSVALKSPEVVDYFALPPESSVSLRDRRPDGFLFRGNELQPAKDSYLGARRLRRKA